MMLASRVFMATLQEGRFKEVTELQKFGKLSLELPEDNVGYANHGRYHPWSLQDRT